MPAHLPYLAKKSGIPDSPVSEDGKKREQTTIITITMKNKSEIMPVIRMFLCLVAMAITQGCATMVLNHNQDVTVINAPKGAQIAVPQRPTHVLDPGIPFTTFNKIDRSEYRTQQLILDLKKSVNRQGMRTNTINTLRDGTQVITIERDRNPITATVFCSKGSKPTTVTLLPKLNMVFILGNIIYFPLGHLFDFIGLFGDYAWTFKDPINLGAACGSTPGKKRAKKAKPKQQ